MFETLTRGRPAHPLEGRLTLTNSTAVEEYIQGYGFRDFTSVFGGIIFLNVIF